MILTMFFGFIVALLPIRCGILKMNLSLNQMSHQIFFFFSGVKEYSVQSVARYWLEHGTSRPKNRGGPRKVAEYNEKKAHIRAHIQTFTCRASHYARRGAPGTKYLPTDLNVAKMHRMFLEQNHAACSYSLYWSIFVYGSNLAFGHPSKDVCSTCVKFRIAVRDPDLTPDEKREKILLYTLHRCLARQFYNLLNNVEDSYTVCFDVMENLVLTIEQTYYSRQLYFYVFGIVHHHGRGGPQQRADVHLYTWLEHQNAKDSNMIASVVRDYLGSLTRAEISQTPSLRLFSDSCYGQNKNIILLSMMFPLCSKQYPQHTVDYYFPIRGHSFLSADRVFGRVEQDIRQEETILLPAEYVEILEMHGVVHEYGKDWQCYDFKGESAAFVKSQRSFKISEARVLQVHGDKLGFKSVFLGNSANTPYGKEEKSGHSTTHLCSPTLTVLRMQKSRMY